MSNPIITVIIPCRNEEKFIGECLISLLEQKDVNDKIEILVVDGMSDDSTRIIVEKISKQNSRVKLLDNPDLFTPYALNIGIRNAKGEFVAILGAHAEYAPDYLTNCLELIKQHPEVSCVGGPIISKGKTPFAKATAIAMSSFIGVGNAKHRFANFEGYAEGACFPIFRKEVFSKIGLFDEELIKNQDDELNLRLHKNNLKVFLSPKAKSFYFVRATPQKLFKQYFDYGFWRVAVIKKHRVPRSIRQIIPIGFFTLLFLLILISTFLPGSAFLYSLTLPVIYFSVLCLFGLALVKRHGIKVGFLFPISVLIIHFSNAAGFLIGIIKFYFRKHG